jgi:hypothetical protein
VHTGDSDDGGAMLAKRTWRTAARVGAAAVLVGALVAAGCAGPQGRGSTSTGREASATATREASAAASLAASDAALLKAIESTSDPDGDLMSRVGRRAEQLAIELAAAPLVAETTITLPGVRENGSVRLPTAPKGNARLRDRYEPDGSRSRAAVLHVGESQNRTISSSSDSDWIALPNDEGPGYYYITASDDNLLVEGTLLRQGEEMKQDMDYAFGPKDNQFYAVTPAGGYGGLGKYSWIKISSEKPVTYRIVHLRALPQSIAGDYAPDQVMLGLNDALAGLNPTEYYFVTGLRTTTEQLRAFRRKLAGGAGLYSATTLGGLTEDPLQRCLSPYKIAGVPIVYWLRTEKRGKNWVLVAAGRDASWKQGSYAEKLRTYLRLNEWTNSHSRMMKPAIYLYPAREQSVTVRLDGSGVLTSTSPVIDSASRSWTVSAKPDGTLTDSAGQRWPYLFWEGLGLPRFDLSTGSVVRGSEVDTFLRTALAERGLNASENAAFREYWVPLLSANPWVLVHFEGAAHERHAPLSVTPEPDVSLRVFMVAKPLSAPVAVAPQRLAPPPRRRGFTLVEWGGTLLP